MKAIICSFVILAAATFVADARLVNARSFRELDKRADIIVVATPVSTKDTAEQIDLPHTSPAIHVVGLSSEFEVSLVLKGDNSLKKLVVHHYRLANPGQRGPNGPVFASFDPKEATRYLLFLQREPDGRYALFDQVDPALTSILKLNGTEWDNMKLDDFKNWLDAKKWLRERPNLSSEISPEITPDGRGDGSLHEAAFNGKLEKAKELIKANPDLVNSHASYASQTPLHLAVEYGHKDVAELLLANKADVEAKSYGGWTPLLNAVFGGHKDLVQLLLTNKAEVNYQEDAGRSPLHVAAENGYTEIAALLLANKADVNVKNRAGDMPLHIAAAFGSKGMVELLLANKAEINAKDNSGRTPLGFAVLHSNNDIAELLRQHGGLE
jgi:ankyrin repeat protein